MFPLFSGPAITVPVGWLAVGHVDEVCCFVDDRTVLVPSPRLAFDLIADISFSGPDHGYQIDQLFYSNGEVMAISRVGVLSLFDG